MAPALDQPDYKSGRTRPKQFIINPKLTSFRLQQTCEYATSYDMQIGDNILLAQFGNKRHIFY